MRRISVVILGLLASTTAFATVSIEPLLNKVTMQLHAEQWVTTRTALVTINVNAAVSGQALDKIQSSVLQRLQQISNQGDWHIVSFNRQLDKSGLESVQIAAQNRLSQSELASVRDRAKSVSKPGETFSVESVQFTPSNEELQQANVNLRNNLYQQARAELDVINKIYPDQKYYLHQIDFTTLPVMPMPQNQMLMKVAAAPTTSLAIGDKLSLDAVVVLASINDQGKQKLAGSAL